MSDTTPTVQELAAKAAAELRRRGWTQGSFYDPDGALDHNDCKVCTLGAINVAAGATSPAGAGYQQGEVGWPLTKAVADRIGRSNALDTYGPTSAIGERWNDQPERTIDDVLAVFDAIANDVAA